MNTNGVIAILKILKKQPNNVLSYKKKRGQAQYDCGAEYHQPGGLVVFANSNLIKFSHYEARPNLVDGGVYEVLEEGNYGITLKGVDGKYNRIWFATEDPLKLKSEIPTYTYDDRGFYF